MPKVVYITLDSKGRATLPEEVREALGVGPGDFVLLEPNGSGGYELVPAALVPKDQRWFRHPQLQERLREAEREIALGASRRESVSALAARVLDAAPSTKTAATGPSPTKRKRRA